MRSDDELVERFWGIQTTIDFPEMLRSGTSLICHVPIDGNLSGARLIGKYLTTKLQNSLYRRPPQERKRQQRVQLYLDEFHHWTRPEFR